MKKGWSQGFKWDWININNKSSHMCVINGNIGLEQLLGSVNPSSPIP